MPPSALYHCRTDDLASKPGRGGGRQMNLTVLAGGVGAARFLEGVVQ